jgi:2-methylcitrate dehydratase PrpD
MPQYDVNPLSPSDFLTRWACDLQFDDIPEFAWQHAHQVFINFVGCAAGGSTSNLVEKTKLALLTGSKDGQSALIGQRQNAPAPIAALINSLAGSIHAFDDTHAQAVIHAGTPVGAALCAVADTVTSPVSGEDFLLAYCVGLEVACRLSMAISVPPAAGPMGWSQTGIVTPIGAALGCAKLLKLDPSQTRNAIGLAAGRASGLRVAHGSMAMHFDPGQAAASGSQAALLAAAGIDGPIEPLAGKYGFLELFADSSNPATLLDELGVRFESSRLSFKAYPCGTVLQAMIEACLAIRARHAIKPEAVQAIQIVVHPAAFALANRPYPANSFEAQVSIQHWAAAAIARDTAGLAEAGEEAIADLAIQLLRQRCKISVDSSLDIDAARVTVVMQDGGQLESTVAHYYGSPANPFTIEDLLRKFQAQATATMGADEGSALLHRCQSLPHTRDVRRILRGIK